jgi:acyl-CoA synthetase (AMP-forming)/AMP-acid ligase II
MHRDAYIAPNTHAHLEAYYAVPQIGAVLVPINYRLLPNDFECIINHCGATVVCAHSDYIEAVECIRGKLKGVEHFVARGVRLFTAGAPPPAARPTNPPKVRKGLVGCEQAVARYSTTALPK